MDIEVKAMRIFRLGSCFNVGLGVLAFTRG